MGTATVASGGDGTKTGFPFTPNFVHFAPEQTQEERHVPADHTDSRRWGNRNVMTVDSLHPAGGGIDRLNRRAQRAQRRTPFSISVTSVCSCLKLSICVHLRDLPAPVAHSIVLFHSAIPDSGAGGGGGTQRVWKVCSARAPNTAREGARAPQPIAECVLKSHGHLPEMLLASRSMVSRSLGRSSAP